MRILHRALMAAALITGVVAAQSADRFDVASIKRAAPASADGIVDVFPGRLWVPNGSVRSMVVAAYGINREQLAELPDWGVRDRFAVTATFPPGTKPTQAEVMVMLRNLLADRFALVTHFEDRPAAVYALVVARKDGRLGRWLSPSKTHCAEGVAERQKQVFQIEAPPSRVSPDSKRPPCGIRRGRDFLTGGAQSTADIAKSLEIDVGKPVLDMTDLSGRFDFDLKFTRPAGIQPDSIVPDDAPIIFTALQEQLGLKLESRRLPIRTLVIDRLEQPTED